MYFVGWDWSSDTVFSEYEMNCAVSMEGRTPWCHAGIPCYVMLCVETVVMVGDIRAMYGRCACMYSTYTDGGGSNCHSDRNMVEIRGLID